MQLVITLGFYIINLVVLCEAVFAKIKDLLNGIEIFAFNYLHPFNFVNFVSRGGHAHFERYERFCKLLLTSEI